MLNDSLALFCATLLISTAGSSLSHAGVDAGKVYVAKCRLCHGASGKPSGPFAEKGVKDLSDPEWQEANSDDQIREVIVDGVEDTLMRAFGKELKAAEVDALIAYIRGLRRK